MGTEEISNFRRAMNRILQDKYVEDCHGHFVAWNNIIRKAGIDYELTLPSPRFNRSMGPFAGLTYTTNGEFVTGVTPTELADRYSPTDDDREYLKSIMQQVREPVSTRTGLLHRRLASTVRQRISNTFVSYNHIVFAQSAS